ncbi:type IV secretion system protein [Erythrobacteraceae bacterium CFH 75059]|uniref:virB8 family protein n=1 Tax=Qipengyuania thermophila TaxID=2509361 RepID=UPI00101FAFDD|nr:type IV secretion system protein [Qipengyuania thermophila]TCD04347.1 type IV secretion system protein [Erythrobacteraceae bacterium CFH 75059]
MNMPESFQADDRVEVADSWSRSVTADLERSRRVAWIVASIAAAIALLLAGALVLLLPLKTTVPYTLLVDRQTGFVEALEPLEAQRIAPDAALTRSFLVQYVTARESFDAADLQRDYRRTALLSAGEARTRYLATMRSGAPGNPLSYLPPGSEVAVAVRSVSSLGANRSLVRFTTTRTDRSGAAVLEEHWAAVIDWRYSDAEMSADDRLLNPLGFQVTRYRKDPETLPEVVRGVAADAAGPPLSTPASVRRQVPGQAP